MNGAPALVRGLEILEEVAAARAPIPLRTLLARTGIPRASLIRLLAELRAHAYLERDRGGYRVGERMRRVFAGESRARRLARAAEGVLAGLRDELGCTASFFAHEAGVVTACTRRVHPAAPAMQEPGNRCERPTAASPWFWILWWEGHCARPDDGPIPRAAHRFYRRTGAAYDDARKIAFLRRLAVPVRGPDGARIDGFLAVAGNSLLLPDAAIDGACATLRAAARRLGAV